MLQFWEAGPLLPLSTLACGLCCIRHPLGELGQNLHTFACLRHSSFVPSLLIYNRFTGIFLRVLVVCSFYTFSTFFECHFRFVAQVLINIWNYVKSMLLFPIKYLLYCGCANTALVLSQGFICAVIFYVSFISDDFQPKMHATVNVKENKSLSH